MANAAATWKLNLVVACQGAAQPAVCEAAEFVLARLRQAHLACTLAADEAALPLYGRHEHGATLCELAAVVPLPGDAVSLASRMAACRRANAAVDAAYVPQGADLLGARAELSRLAILAVIDAGSLASRPALPPEMVRLPVQIAAPAASWWKRLAAIDLSSLQANGARCTAVLIDAERLAGAGSSGRRQVSQLIDSLREWETAGLIQTSTLRDVAAALSASRRRAPQQSILRAA